MALRAIMKACAEFTLPLFPKAKFLFDFFECGLVE